MHFLYLCAGVELIQNLLLLIYHIFFKCHWICLLLLTRCMFKSLYSVWYFSNYMSTFSILSFKYSAAFMVMRILLISLMSNTGITHIDEILLQLFLHPVNIHLLKGLCKSVIHMLAILVVLWITVLPVLLLVVKVVFYGCKDRSLGGKN